MSATFYHATRRECLPSILREGLRPDVEKRWANSERGVYLAQDPVYALGVIFQELGFSFFEDRVECDPTRSFYGSDASPHKVMQSFCVIVIDSSRVDEKRLRTDPDVVTSWVYDGVVDVTSMPILSVEEALSTARVTGLSIPKGR
jgi:hypothetical protein